MHSIFRHPLSLFIIFFVLFFGMFFYYRQHEFSQAYDSAYWKDRYDHSQYQLPLSKRGIGDDGLYAYAGYRIINGDDPTKAVFDKPGFGLLVIGIFIKLFNNPLYSGLFFGIGSLLVLYLLAKKLLHDSLSAGFITTLFLVNPLFFTHLSLSLLDVMQLFFLLLSFYFYAIFFSAKKNIEILIFLSAFFLGLSAQTKIPFYIPIVVVLQVFFIVKERKWVPFVSYCLGGVFSLVVSAIPYLDKGYSFLEYLRIQKYIISIYQASKLELHPEAVWQFIFNGSFPEVVTRKSLFIEEWSIFLPIVTILGLLSIREIFSSQKKEILLKGIGFFVIATLLVMSIIPIYPRYVLIVLPFLYIFVVYFIKRHVSKKMFIGIFLIALVYGLVNAFIFFHPKPDMTLQTFYNNFSRRYFQDMYQENIMQESKPSESREKFYKNTYDFFEKGKIRAITVNETKNTISRFDDKGTVTVRITYFTEYLGSFSEEKQIKLEKEHNIWKVVWDLDYLLNGYKPGYQLVSKRTIGERGTIYDKGGSGLGEDRMGYLISFNPSLMSPAQEKPMLFYLSTLSSLKETHQLQNAYLENVPKHTSVPLFTTFSDLFKDELKKLTSFKGITYQAYPTRIYTNLGHAGFIQNTVYDECCTRIYSSYNYHGVKDPTNPEYIHDEKLSGYDGGSLELQTKEGKKVRTLLKKEAKNGSEVKL